MNIFRRKRALLDEIADLNGQIGVQSREMAALRKANTDLNLLWEEKKKECKKLTEELREKGNEYAAELGARNRQLEDLNRIVDEQSDAIHELQDTNNGLASSVTELKSKLRAKEKQVRELNARIDNLKSKLSKQ